MGRTFMLHKSGEGERRGGKVWTWRGGMLDNRRQSVRVTIETEVICEVGSRRVRGVTWNLSQGGIQVEASGLQPGDAIRLSFRLPVSGTPINAAGQVVWSKDTRQGIQFTQMTTQNEQSIRNFIVAAEP